MRRNEQEFARVIQALFRTGQGRAPTPLIIVVGVLLVGYLLAEPWLEARWGLDLPGLHLPPRAPVLTAPAPAGEPDAAESTKDASGQDNTVESLIGSDRDVYTSPAGLRYTGGSQHRHRLRHLMAHTQDAPDRPVHGVFDDKGVHDVIKLVDEAYRQALAETKSRQRQEGDRRVYTVDLGRRIGYIGGESGARRGEPAARHVQLVLIEDRLITAYPIIPKR